MPSGITTSHQGRAYPNIPSRGRRRKDGWTPGGPAWRTKEFRVFGSVRKQADAERLQKEFGNGFVPLTMDVTDADAVGEAARKVGSTIGDLNRVGLVNDAGSW